MDTSGKYGWVGPVAMGVVILVVVNKLFKAFGSSASDRKDEADAADFTDPHQMPALWDTQAYTHFLTEHASSMDAIQAQVAPLLPAIGVSIKNLMEAPGVFNDDEVQAVSAITSLSSWPEALLFAQTFPTLTDGRTVGAWIAGSFGEAEMAQVVRHLRNLQTSYVAPR